MNGNRNGSHLFSLTAILVVAGVLTFSIGVLPAFSAQETFKWRLQSSDTGAFVPAGYIQEGFINRIKDMSNGRIQIELFTGGQLVPTVEIVNALKSGMVNMAYCSGVYFTGEIPEANLEYAALPPALLKSVDDIIEVYWYRGLDDIIREGYAKKNVYYLGTLPQGDANTHWSKKLMQNTSELKGYKIRAFGYTNKVFQNFGATPVFVPHEEAYSALAQGVIDGYFTGGLYYKINKMYEVAPYYYLPGWNPVQGMAILISMDTWNKLPDDLKAIVQEAFKGFSIEHAHKRYEQHAKMVQEFKSMGVTLVQWPEEEMNKVREQSVGFLPEVAAKSESCARGLKILTDYMVERGYTKK